MPAVESGYTGATFYCGRKIAKRTEETTGAPHKSYFQDRFCRGFVEEKAVKERVQGPPGPEREIPGWKVSRPAPVRVAPEPPGRNSSRPGRVARYNI